VGLGLLHDFESKGYILSEKRGDVESEILNLIDLGVE
jgi:hypothetical protein